MSYRESGLFRSSAGSERADRPGFAPDNGITIPPDVDVDDGRGAMLVILAAALLMSWAAVVRDLHRVNERHALAGLFGDPAREAILARRAKEVIDAAARAVRLSVFERHLNAHAWSGTVVRVERQPNRSSCWRFGDGTTWKVCAQGARLRRAVICGASQTPEGTTVKVYDLTSYEEQSVVVGDAVET